MGRLNRLPVIEKLLVTDIAAEGKSVAFHNGIVVFVRQAVPGDLVDVQLLRKRKHFMEGCPVRFHAYSEKRTTPFCEHFGTCGGCTWQHLPYGEQLRYKQKQVIDQLTRIGKIGLSGMESIIASPCQTYYRNKLEFTFSDDRWLTPEEINSGVVVEERRALGFHIPGKFDKVFDVKFCYLQPEPSNDIRKFVRSYALEHNLEFFNLRRQEGLLRNLIIRNTSGGEFMVIMSFFRNEPEAIEGLLSAIALRFPAIASLYYVINSKANDTITDLKPVFFRGKRYLEEVMGDLRFRISPKSFFQTNTGQAYELYRVVREYAGLSGKETVYDLYTGTGTIALFLAKHCKKVVGIDYIEEAIADAERNAEVNLLRNTEFAAGDIKDLLNDAFIKDHGPPDVIIADPPRTGMHKDVVSAIMKLAPQRIVYVSCNPATQARDIRMLSGMYHAVRSQPVDMFPHTAHVENVVLLDKD
ncbi:MAG: 23S rRNA (uracil(1939)-C(5))-methyltransferase RlmD [Bacteroidales bacterium]|nr:23S rRNA (uracil(1939)-C(5))-methyltransferase RlmD [Bacteroidales bacterium]